MMALCGIAAAVTETYYFTTAGDTTAWPALPRLTGKDGIPTSQTGSRQAPATVTVTVIETTAGSGGSVSPGAIAGIVIGMFVFAVLATVAVMLGLKGLK